jgi:hypothetical protein
MEGLRVVGDGTASVYPLSPQGGCGNASAKLIVFNLYPNGRPLSVYDHRAVEWAVCKGRTNWRGWDDL